MSYKVLLVDDEYLALNLLEQFIQQLPELELVGKCKSAVQALDFLNKHSIDILFLDIQMPVLSGISLLKTLRHMPATIFTTAYADYAVEAFNLNVTDYLLKPFSFERFLQAVNKAKEHLDKSSNNYMEPLKIPELELFTKDYLVIKADGKIEKIFFKDIQFIEGMKEYVKFVCEHRHYLTLETMKDLETSLPEQTFIRVHKSYIVSKPRVQSLEGNLLVIDKHKIPVSRERKDMIIKAIFDL